ncbi:MAG: hypothetical protein LC620_04095 [Halobacteriales archaeon]|nr:hypothetical protein [Halobacteriales archaeon]
MTLEIQLPRWKKTNTWVVVDNDTIDEFWLNGFFQGEEGTATIRFKPNGKQDDSAVKARDLTAALYGEEDGGRNE